MDVTIWLYQTQQRAGEWFNSLGPDDFYMAWLASGVVLFAVLARISYLIMRRALGHRRFRGTWYNEIEFEVLLKMIEEDIESGRRVMRHDEMTLYRSAKLGWSSPVIRHNPGSYF